MQANVYNSQGKESGKIELPEALFGAPWNADLVHQVVISMESNARIPYAHAKDRGAVRGGGKKPWRQKGTGNARHGSIRSPIWRGGGATFGPLNERNFKKKINKKMRQKALASVLSRKLNDGEVLFVEAPEFTEPKAARAKELLSSLSGIKGYEGLATKQRNAALVTFAEYHEPAGKSFRNLSSVSASEVRNLNPVEALRYKYLIITNPQESLNILASKAALSSKAKETVAA